MLSKWTKKKIFGVLLFFGFLLLIPGTVHAANPISLNVQNKPIKEVLKLIEKQSGNIFIYKVNEINLDRIISVEIKNLTIESALNRIFEGSEIEFSIVNRQVILTRKSLKTPQSGSQTIPRGDKRITGKVTDIKGEPIIGANILVKGSVIGNISDFNGNFTLNFPDHNATIVVTYIGYQGKEIKIGEGSFYNVVLEETTATVEEVVVVGYGSQKKETLVGAISQTKGETLMRAGGVTNLAQSLTGQLPGVTTLVTSAQPGKDDPLIYIRGQSTWNGGQPLILVDGVERTMNDLDVSEVESVSVLKDASATAVFGVKGADGVILITTKRGTAGKPQFTVSANSASKMLSKLPKRLNSYQTLLYRNEAIEREVLTNPTSWASYTPLDIVEKYNPTNPDRANLQWMYPDVDWLNTLVKDVTYSQRVNASVSGGTDFVTYFGSIAYTHDGDLFNSQYNQLYKYDPGYTYDRFNFRSNLDFQLTNTTKFSVNLSGYVGNQKTPEDFRARGIFNAYLRMGADLMVAQFPDGMYGYNPSWSDGNPLANLNNTGVVVDNRTQVASDFILNQKLDFITKGLFFKASLSFDNYFSSTGNNINGGNGTNFQTRRITPEGIVEYLQKQGTNGFQFIVLPKSSNIAETVSGSDINQLEQALVYEFSLNYGRKIKDHDIGALALFKRRENSTGAIFPNYREDWVGRLTYNFKERYFTEVNAAYNGSEKFDTQYRFGFFPSLAIGWMLSNEKFIQQDWLDKLKIRYSVGKVGNDAGIARWQYISDWDAAGYMPTGLATGPNAPLNFPYIIYKEKVIANPDLHWETAVKNNLGFEMSVLKNMLSLNIDVFNDDRDGIFLSSNQRKLPTYFGFSPVAGNIGKTKTNGYEIELKFNKMLSNGLFLWANFNMTHSKDIVIYREDPELLPDYQKLAGFQIGQTKMGIYDGVMQNWNDVYSGVSSVGGLQYRLPGDYMNVDFNGDGLIDSYDAVPVGYPNRPQNTYNYTVGTDYKGLSLMLQFYAVNNVSRSFQRTTFYQNYNVAFEYDLDYWTPENGSNDKEGVRYMTPFGHSYAQLFDGSFVRLKTAEISYTFKKRIIDMLGLKSGKIFINGNNLLYWSKMPDDREGANTTEGESDNYPLHRQINLGFNVTF